MIVHFIKTAILFIFIHNDIKIFKSKANVIISNIRSNVTDKELKVLTEYINNLIALESKSIFLIPTKQL